MVASEWSRYNWAPPDGSNYNRVNPDGSNYNWEPFGKHHLALCVRVLAPVADRARQKVNACFSVRWEVAPEVPGCNLTHLVVI